jgi:D-alanyl-D-alanine carboxypeptidase (penicillin-binding protein 5/6)
MWIKKSVLIVIVIASIFSITQQVQASPSVSAESAILMDADSGRILYSKNERNKQRIASITKIMTALLATESDTWEKKTRISARAIKTEGSSLYLKKGDRVSVKDLTYGLMLRSGNDAANAIAEEVGGSIESFIYLMNEKAREIGMFNSHFTNPNGLDEGQDQYSCAYDMALLTKYALKNKKFQNVFKTSSYQATISGSKVTWVNKHKLLTGRYENTTGGKTGYTTMAKRTLVTAAQENNEKLIVVTLNDSNDWEDHIRLFEYGFQTFEQTIIFHKNERISLPNPYHKVEGIMKKNVKFPITKIEKENLEYIYEWDKSQLKAQAQSGHSISIGRVTVRSDHETIGSELIWSIEKKKKPSKENWIQKFKSILLIQFGGNEHR